MRKKKDAELMLRWLVLNPMSKFKKHYVAVVVLNVLSTLFQLAGMLTLIKIFTLFRNGWKLAILGYKFDLLPDKHLAFVCIGGVSLLLIALAAAFRYLSRRVVTHIARLCEEHYNIILARCYLAQFEMPESALATSADLKSMQEYFARGGRYVGRAIMVLSNSIVPSLTAIVSFGYMLYLKPFVSLSFLLVLLLVLPVYIYITKRGVTESKVLTTEARAAAVERIRALNNLRYSTSLESANEFDVASIGDSPAARNFMNAYEFRLRISTMVSAFTQGVQTLMILVILIGCAFPLLDNASTEAVSAVLVYFAAFKLFGGGLQNIMSTIVMANLFYTYSAPMIRFLDNSFRDKPVSEVGDSEESVIDQNKMLAVSVNQDVDWASIYWVLRSLGHASDKEALGPVRLLNGSQAAVDDDLYKSLGVAEDFTFETLDSWNSVVARRVKVYVEEAINSYKSGEWRKENWDRFSVAAKLACFACEVSKESESLLLLIDGKAMASFSLDQRISLLEALSAHKIIFYYVKAFVPPDLHEAGVTKAYYLDDEGVYWQGDTCDSNVSLLNRPSSEDEVSFDEDMDMLLE